MSVKYVGMIQESFGQTSSVIKELLWAPPETVLRRAKGSDNWPMTWDDDWLYVAYGDGNGFEPRLKEKLSLGLSRVLGNPPRAVTENLRAPSLEQKGTEAAFAATVLRA